MKTENIIKKIESNREEIKSKGVKKLGVFGSTVKGKKNPKDIDILVEFNFINADNYFELLFLLEGLFKKKIDLIIEKNLRPELNYVKKEAVYVKI